MNTSTASEAATVDLKKLKGYPFLFFLSNLFHFKRKYWLTFWNGITIGIFSFGQAYLINDAINSYDTITTEKLFSFYLPASIGLFLFPEGLGYLQRRYGEAVPIQYQDFLQSKVAEQLMNHSSYPLINANKERFHQLLTKFYGDVRRFCDESIWLVPQLLAQIVLAGFILFTANVYLFFFNIAYMSCFFVLGFYFSKRYETKWKKFLQADVKFNATNLHSFVTMNSIKEMRQQTLYRQSSAALLADKNKKHNEVTSFHATRWLVQLSLYSLLQILVLGTSLYFIIQGSLEPGFIVLAYWAFQTQWRFMQYNIENFAVLRESRTNSLLLEQELEPLLTNKMRLTTDFDVDSWSELRLSNINIEPNILSIEQLSLKRQEKYVISGQSGSGKSTLVKTLLNLLEHDGSYHVDNAPVKGQIVPNTFISLLTSTSVLVQTSLQQNLLHPATPQKEARLTALRQQKSFQFITDDALQEADSSNYSQGQLQRIRLLQLLLTEAEIYILDEPFNGIDKENIADITRMLQEFLADKTVIAISHHEGEFDFLGDVTEIAIRNGTIQKVIDVAKPERPSTDVSVDSATSIGG